MRENSIKMCVKFLKKYGKYNTEEIAGFSEKQANQLAELGIVEIDQEATLKREGDRQAKIRKVVEIVKQLRTYTDSPERIDQWPMVRHLLKEKFGKGRSNCASPKRA